MTNCTKLLVAATAAVIVSTASAARAQDCAAVIAGNPQLSEFSGALARLGVANLLQRPGPFTVLAPTNQAIGRLPVNIRNDLAGAGPADDIDPIRGPAVINAHIVDGRHTSDEVRGKDNVQMRTRNGNLLLIQRGADNTYTLRPETDTWRPERRGFGLGGMNRIEAAHVVQADIPCSNGVVHIVDQVLVR